MHSPLVEWSSERNHNNNELSKEKALQIVNSISRKLRGLHARNKQLLPLSVEGDVQRTIQVGVFRIVNVQVIQWCSFIQFAIENYDVANLFYVAFSKYSCVLYALILCS